jgi:DNA primase
VKYAVLIYSTDEGPAAPNDHEVYMELSERESTIGGAQLQPIATATTVRVHDGEALTTDGPFAETKEAFGGFYLIDANQNGQGKTIASVYSVRPRPGATVSTPLRWEEVTPGLDPGVFTMGVVLDRIDRLGDLAEPLLTTRQSLRKALSRLEGG